MVRFGFHIVRGVWRKMKFNEFLAKVHQILSSIEETQAESIAKASALVSECLLNDGIVYTFGTGHSHCVAEEVCWRAGCLVPIDAILEPSLTGHTQVVKSGMAERLEGFSKVILDHRELGEHDVMIVISNSGINAAPIEMAIEARKRNLPVIAITSLEYSKQSQVRQSGGKKLYEVASVAIDNCTPWGDAVMRLEGLRQPVGPVSNIAAMTIMHAIMVQAEQNMLDKGTEPPVFMSGNLDGGNESNAPLLRKYRDRVLLWY